MTYDDDPRMRMRPVSRSRMPLRVGIAAGALALVGAVGGTAFAWSQSNKPAGDNQAKPSPSASASTSTPSPSLSVTPSCTTDCDGDADDSHGSGNNNSGNGTTTKTVQVPDVRTKNETYARQTLSDKDLSAKVTYVCPNDGTDVGVVKNQNPYSGNVNAGSSIKLDVVGVQAPDVANKNESYAKHAIENIGLVYKVTYKASASVTAGNVITASPSGICVKQGSTVTVTVAVAATQPSQGTQGNATTGTDTSSRG